MNRLFAVSLASGLLFGCSVNPLGSCSATSNNCVAPATCDVKHDPPICVVPQGACFPGCKNNEQCINTQCVVTAPAVGTVTAPATWSKRSQTVTVTAVVDGTGGLGIASATLQVAGQPDIAGTTSDTGLIRTYTFNVPGSVQAAGSETPVNFTVVATDTAGHTTPTAAVGSGQLLIDDVGPTVQGVTVNGGVAVQGIKWFKQAASGSADAQVGIVDAGSGVDTASLTLVSGGTRLDTGTPTCAAGQSAQALVCHFAVPLSTAAVPTGGQRLISFAVAGADKAGNAVKTNVAALGIDGKPPSITFTIGAAGSTGKTTTYPVNFADCNLGTGTIGTVDATMYCGHDGLHFYRSGDGKYSLTFTVTDVYIAPDDKGSGVDNSQGASTCSIAGSTATCTVTYDTATSSFKFPANFAGATFTSSSEGTGTVSATVTAKDMVGNVATSTPLVISATRVKWMRSMAGKVDTFKGSPVVTTQPTPQIILAANEKDISGPIVSIAPDGSILWRAGHGDASVISNNVAYSSATKRLYVLGDNSNQLFAYDATNIVSGVAQKLFSCPIDDGALSTGQATGAPAILGGTPERVLVADSGEHRLWAFAKSGTLNACAASNQNTNNGGTWTGGVNPPVTDGNNVFVGHDTTKLARVPFAGGSFGSVTEAPTFSHSILNNVALAGNLFFGDRSVPGTYFAYDAAALTPNVTWAANATTPGAMADALLASPVVGASFVFGAAASGDGHLKAFNTTNGSLAFSFPTAGAGNISAVTIDANNVMYFGDDANKELSAVKVVGTLASIADGWTASYKGSTATGPVTTLGTGVPTESTIDSNGVLYFATPTTGNVYALITESSGPLAPTAGSTWPRVGYDNCNSSNTAFTCQ